MLREAWGAACAEAVKNTFHGASDLDGRASTKTVLRLSQRGTAEPVPHFGSLGDEPKSAEMLRPASSNAIN
jgi:hypothetical protein